MNQIPESDRPVVANYLPVWDKGVQGMTQKIHNEYAPYKPLLDLFDGPDEIVNMKDWIDLINEDPVQFITAYREWLESEGIELPDSTPPQKTEVPPVENDPIAEKLSKMEEMVNKFNDYIEGVSQKEKETEESKQLDGLLSKMEDEFGKFHRPTVIDFLAEGKSPKEAVEAFNEVVKQYSNGTSKPNPLKALTGAGGAIPQDQANNKELTRNDRKNLAIAALMAAKG